MTKTADPARFTPQHWPVAGRPIEPFRIDHNANDPDTMSPTPIQYLLDPIHPRLFALDPEDASTFVSFVADVGISEFLEWSFGHITTEPWVGMFEAFTGDRGIFTDEELAAAWLNPRTTTAVLQERKPLLSAYQEATKAAAHLPTAANDAQTATAITRHVRQEGWELQVFRLDLDVDPRTGVVFERPTHLWARAWFELIDGIANHRFPKACLYCHNPFTPRRRNQRYCTGTGCQQRAYDQKRSRSPKRVQYQKDRYEERKSRTQEDNPSEGRS